MAQPDSSAIRFSQRNSCNTAYVETYVSGTNFIIGTDSTGSIRGFTSINLSGSITSASFSVSSSYATSASYAPSQLITGETYPITSSWATSSISSSYALTASAVTITDTISGSGPYYITFVDGTSGTRAIRTDSSVLTWNATTNTLSSSGNLYVAGGTVDSDAVPASLFPSATIINIGSTGPNPLTTFGGDIKLSSGLIKGSDGSSGLGIASTGITIYGNAISSSLGTGNIRLGTNGDVTASNNLKVVGVSTLGTVSASIFVGSHTGSLFGTSSWATNSLTASYVTSSNIVGTVTSASYSLSASYVSNVISNAITSPNSQTNITTNNNGISASVSGTQILTVITQSSITSQNGSSSFQLNGRLSASNVNVGVPNDSYPWGTSLIGSYFSTWNTDTNVSDILRFFAGAFSSSYPTPAPNTKTFASITTTSTLGSTVTINGRVPTGSTNVNINYLQPLGWSTVGSTVFSGFTFRGGTNYLSYGSTTGGSTTVSSSLGSSAFGLGSLTNGNVTAIHLSGSFTITFASSSAGTINYTNTASVLLTQASINTVTPTVASPISLNSIPSANTAVIPSVYQDGYFNNFTGSNLTNSISLSSVSSSGIYGFTGSVGLNSGSSPYTFYTGTNTTVYYTPLTDASFSTNTITSPNSTITASTAVSRSLSGAPYLTSGSTYRYTVTGSGAFNPLYINGTVSTVTIPTNNLGLTTANSTTLTTNPTIQTTGVVKSSDYITTRAVGSYPYESDVIVFDVTMGAAGTTNTVAQSGSSISTFTLTNTTYNRAGSGTTIGSQTVNIHTAGSFGQPSSSGSLLYYGRPNGYTTASLTFGSQSLNPGAITEQFLDEAYRLTLANNILSWSGSYVNSSSYLPTSSLQVKPGYLVDPGGTYRYWYPSGYGTTYKYYVRHFQSSVVINKLQITVAGNTSLVGWDSTSAGMAIALIFESGNSNVYSNCRLYDVSNTGQNLITSNITTSDLTTVGTNPFSSSIDLYGNNGTGASVSSGVIIFPMRTADGAVLDNTNASKDEVYVLVRYKGSTTPLTSIKIEKLS